MIVTPAGNISYPSRREAKAPAPAVSPVIADPVSISAAARSLQLRDADLQGQWQSALAMSRGGSPQLVNADSAMQGGIADLQGRLQQLLAEHGLPAHSSFSLTYDAAKQSYNVEGPPTVKAAIEAELNGSRLSASAQAIREGFSTLSDLSGSLAAVREQYARVKAGGDSTGAGGYAYRFSLDMLAGILSSTSSPRNHAFVSSGLK